MDDKNLDGELTESAREFLFGLEMFSRIPDLQPRIGSDITPAADFLSICTEYQFDRGAVIAHKLDVAEGMYIFRSGTVDAWDSSFANEEMEQEFQWIREFTTDDILGDGWLIVERSHPYLLRARKKGSFILIKRNDFIKFVGKHQKVMRLMYPHMSDYAKDKINQSKLRRYLLRPNSRWSLFSSGDRVQLINPDGTVDSELPPQVNRIKLLPNEQVLFFARRTWKLFALSFGFGILVTLLVAIISYLALNTIVADRFYVLTFTALITAIPGLYSLFLWINWRNLFFIITTNQLIRSEYKILQFRSALERIDLNKVQSISVEKTNFLQKWFNVGTAQITTAAQSSVIYFDYVDRPERVEASIQGVAQNQSQLELGKRRAEMRAIINDHYAVDTKIKKVKGFKSAPKPKTYWQRVRENFVRMENSDGITYHKHPIALVREMIGPLIASVFLVATWYGLSYFDGGVLLREVPYMIPILIFLTIANLFWFWWEFEDWHNDTFQITKQYIYDIDRLPLGLSESRKQAELNRIENVRTEKDGLLPTIFNFGAVHVETAGAENNIIFENVKDPDAVQQAIFKKRGEYERALERRGNAGQLDMIATLVELHSEGDAQMRTRRYRALPQPKDDADEEYDFY